jgi:hypothetical protein
MPIMKKALNTCNNYRDEFIAEWHKCFGNDYVIGDDGEDIRWESIDADMHISSFHEVTEPKDNEIAQMFAHYPWLNVSEVARAIGINKSLMARYIYGISKPSEKRVQQIRDALHQFGKDLLSA